MNAVKETILKRIRTGMKRGKLPAKTIAPLRDRLQHPSRSITPGRVPLSGKDRVSEFVRMTTGEGTTVSFVDLEQEVPAMIEAFLSERDLPEAAVLAPDPSLRGLSWDRTHLQIRFGKAEKEDLVGITPAFAGIAETGALMLLSGPSHPYTLNFLPDNHIAVLHTHRIVGTPEDAFELMRKELGIQVMPRTVLMVTGPSRSADIGTSLQFGAHGPKRLHCILIRGNP